jgi:hypothetical protein
MSIMDLMEAARREKRREKTKRDFTHMAVGAFFGAAAGLFAGYLAAPRAGRETRRMLAEKGIDWLTSMRETVESVCRTDFKPEDSDPENSKPADKETAVTDPPPTGA